MGSCKGCGAPDDWGCYKNCPEILRPGSPKTPEDLTRSELIRYVNELLQQIIQLQELLIKYGGKFPQ